MYHRTLYLAIWLIFLGFSQKALGQTNELSSGQIELIEAFIESTEEEGDIDFEDVIDQLSGYFERPIDLNNTTIEELENSYLLNTVQANSLIDHISKNGKLMTIYELQSVRSFDMATIRAIQPFVSVDSKLENFNVSLGDLIKGGKDEVIIRLERTIQQKKGFKEKEDGSTPYLGDPNRLYIRYRHSYENRFSFGLTGEKDEGEEFGTGSNKQGFDFYSAHAYLKDYSKTLKAVAVGDYTLRLGQGLVIYNGFTNRKSSLVTSIKRGGYTLQPYKSVGEGVALRGASATIGIGDHISITPFISFQARDANVFEVPSDTLLVAAATIQFSGKHRTLGEIEDEQAANELLFGGRIQGKWNKFKIGINAVRTSLSFKEYSSDSDISIHNGSVDYSYSYRNFQFFGETAASDRSRLNPNQGGIATTNSLLIGLTQNTQLALLYRNFGINYSSSYSRPFANGTRPENENGLYLGLKLRPLKQIFIYAYTDIWYHPEVKSGNVFPTNGREFFARIRYYKKRQTEIYIQFRRKSTEDNDSRSTANIDPVVAMNRTQYRLHLSHNLSKTVTWRNRIEYINYSVIGREDAHGFMAYQDILVKPREFPISFTTRFAIFDTDPDQFRTSPYAYENDILYSFFIPAYSGRGTRFYLNLRYRPTSNLTLEARYEQTHLTNSDSFSSGNEEVLGSTRSRIKAQIKFQF